MEKTIEERAYRKSLKMLNPNFRAVPTTRELLVEMATEQKAIDIDKACEMYEMELRQMIRILNEVKNGAGELISVEGSVILFRKAMEEPR